MPITILMYRVSEGDYRVSLCISRLKDSDDPRLITLKTWIFKTYEEAETFNDNCRLEKKWLDY